MPSAPGVYWLRSENRIIYIGESGDLRRRLSEHADKEAVRFQYDTLSEYCSRYPVSRPLGMSDRTLRYKIENTEFRAYRARFGGLPPENTNDNHYEAGLLEETLDYIHSVGNRWF